MKRILFVFTFSLLFIFAFTSSSSALTGDFYEADYIVPQEARFSIPLNYSTSQTFEFEGTFAVSEQVDWYYLFYSFENNHRFYFSLSPNFNSSGPRVRPSFNTISSSNLVSVNFDLKNFHNYRVIFRSGEQKVYLDDSLVYSSSLSSSFTLSSLYLLGSDYNYFSGYFKNFSIKIDDVLIANYIPYYDSINKVFNIYDSVSNLFITLDHGSFTGLASGYSNFTDFVPYTPTGNIDPTFVEAFNSLMAVYWTSLSDITVPLLNISFTKFMLSCFFLVFALKIIHYFLKGDS